MIASDIHSLPNRFFQPALSDFSVAGNPTTSAYANDCLGKLVTDLDDIEQCIHIILTTPIGSAVHRPLFGSKLHLYLDHPITSARPHIVREAVNALCLWEPRIEVLKVSVLLVGMAKLACIVEWKFSARVAEEAFLTKLTFLR